MLWLVGALAPNSVGIGAFVFALVPELVPAEIPHDAACCGVASTSTPYGEGKFHSFLAGVEGRWCGVEVLWLRKVG